MFARFDDCVELRRVIKILVVAVTPLGQVGGNFIVVGRVYDGVRRGWVAVIIIDREVDGGWWRSE